jgi:3-hydroxyacyl-CoA dehydrogenase / 3-hydroxy-2-methylbutyryl-CoA dehydrogenase
VLDICKKGGYAAILDFNEELGGALAKELGASARFFRCDVSDTESIAAAVKGLTTWTHETGKQLGGIIPAAGVGHPGLVCLFSPPLRGIVS